MHRVDIKPQGAAVTRSLSPPPDCATTAGAATGVMAAPERTDSHEALQAEAAGESSKALVGVAASVGVAMNVTGAVSVEAGFNVDVAEPHAMRKTDIAVITTSLCFMESIFLAAG